MMRKWLAAALTVLLMMVCSAAALADEGIIVVDENGMASWDAVPGATGYEYVLVTADYTALKEAVTAEPSVQLPEGLCVHVRAVLPGGEYGEWMMSDFFGTPADSSGVTLPDDRIRVDENGLAVWDAVPGATGYEYVLITADYTALKKGVTAEPSVQLPEGLCVHVRAVMPDGSYGEWMMSDFFGTPADSSGVTLPDNRIRVDENGVASWDAVPGATGYEYVFVDVKNAALEMCVTAERSVQLPEGLCVHVRAVMPDGSYGDWMPSDFFGTPADFSGVTLPDNRIRVDENGVVTWNAVPGASGYEYVFMDGANTATETMFTAETSVQLFEGFCAHVRAVLPDGSYGEWMMSEFFGTPACPAGMTPPDAAQDGENTAWEDPMVYVDMGYSVKWSDLSTYDVIANIDYASVRTMDDGSVYFEAAAPDGSVMRFAGTGVSVAQGEITFAPGGRLSALDAIGRICAIEPVLSRPAGSDDYVRFTGAYSFTDAVSVNSMQDLFYVWGTVLHANTYDPDSEQYKYVTPMSCMNFQPNFIVLDGDDRNQGAFSLSGLIVYYDLTTFHTGIRMMALEPSMYGTYMEGEAYDVSKEQYDSAQKIYDFYLLVIPDVADEKVRFEPDPLVDEMTSRSLLDIDFERYVIGALKDADGNVMDKQSAKLTIGSTVEVTLGRYTMDVALPVIGFYTGAANLHELTPYDNAYAQGDVMTLVVPVVWEDQKQQASDENLEALRAELGRIADESGSVTDHSSALTDRFSLSAYYDAASYGKYAVTSFVTDWYEAPFPFEGRMENESLSGGDFPERVYAWAMSRYPDMDWSLFDRDADGFLDSFIIVNFGVDTDGEMLMGTHSHAVHVSRGYTGEGAGTPQRPRIKNFISMNASFLGDNTLIHEFAHRFGLIDYYDVTYSGIDAVGSYDMQAGSFGDWNAYSKYAAGWIEPEIVQGLSAGQSVEITIGAFADTGDAIVIPAAGAQHDGPFGEYILIDLFTAGGVNRYDAAAFGLNDAAGVRIYHVSASMEKRVLTGSDGTLYPIGTVHYANAYNTEGRYLIELIQSGGDNTFTDKENLRPRLTAQDLFAAGDVFTADGSEFFANGRMDDGSQFGYIVEIVRIERNDAGEYSAVVRITRR